MSRPLLLVVSAMAEETKGLDALLRLPDHVDVDFSVIGIGKVDAAAHTAELLVRRQPHWLVLVGVAGALRPHLRLGALGIVTGAIDADLDVTAWRPGFRRGQHPLTRECIYRSDTNLASLALAAGHPGAFPAVAATGSAFLDERGKAAFLRDTLPQLSAQGEDAPSLIDMETSAFLQVCHRHRAPALALRSVSDTLEGDASADFEAFLRQATHSYAPVLQYLLDHVGR